MANSTPMITLPADQTAISGAKSKSNYLSNQPSSTDKFMNTMSEVSGVAAPVTSAVAYNSGGKSSQVVAAAVNAAATSSGGGTSYLTGGGASLSGSYGGMTAGVSTSGYGTSSSSGAPNLEAMLASNAQHQAYMVGVQMEMGNQQITNQSVSYAINIRDSNIKSTIQNWKL